LPSEREQFGDLSMKNCLSLGFPKGRTISQGLGIFGK